MENLDLTVLRALASWRRAGQDAVLATVVHTWGSSPRPIGCIMALRGDGMVMGSVSGGCIEYDLIDRYTKPGTADALAHEGPPQFVKYGVTADEAHRFGLPCGGNLRLVQEPLQDTAWIDEVLDRTARHELVARTLNLETGTVGIEAAARGEKFQFDGNQLRALFGPRWRLLIIGAGQLSRVLAQMALALDFEVICCDPREEYHVTWEVPGTRFSKAMPDDLVLDLELDPHSAVVAVTHDPKLDDLVLLEALKSPAFYVGALGSRGNTATRKQRLALFDLAPAEIDRLHGPIGLDLGCKTPAEIAISIMAEIVSVKNGVALTQKKRGSAVPAASGVRARA